MKLTPVLTMIRFIPMFITGLSCNLIVALVVGKIDVVFLIGRFCRTIWCPRTVSLNIRFTSCSLGNGTDGDSEPALRSYQHALAVLGIRLPRRHCLRLRRRLRTRLGRYCWSNSRTLAKPYFHGNRELVLSTSSVQSGALNLAPCCS